MTKDTALPTFDQLCQHLFNFAKVGPTLPDYQKFGIFCQDMLLISEIQKNGFSSTLLLLNNIYYLS
jgi:hypothetical protein